MRTTVDIDDPILKDLRRLQKREGKSLGRLVSELLSQALGQRRASAGQPAEFRWISSPMRAHVDLEDREAVFDVMERSPPARRTRRANR
jgi:hypothetical protein